MTAMAARFGGQNLAQKKIPLEGVFFCKGVFICGQLVQDGLYDPYIIRRFCGLHVRWIGKHL